MNALVRWWRFNLVGAAGVVVQLATLAMFTRWLGWGYLAATAAALEITLLHNFAWHVRYTWRDAVVGSPEIGMRLLRFHFSNGMVSLAGNLFVMRVLVDGVRCPVLAANGVAILVCSMVNFWLGERWIFNAGDGSQWREERRRLLPGRKCGERAHGGGWRPRFRRSVRDRVGVGAELPS